MDSVVFLDVDGVLHPAAEPGADALDGVALFQPATMELLRMICHATSPPASVVLTSNWRKAAHTTKVVDQQLREAGIEAGVSSTTDSAPHAFGDATAVRRQEICSWLRNYSPSRFVILDDLPLGATLDHVDAESRPRKLWGHGAFTNMSEHCVGTDHTVGLDSAGAALAVQKLRDDALVWEGETFDSD